MLNFDPEMQPLMQKNNFGNFVRKLGPSPPKNVNFAKSFYVTHYSPNSKSKAENYEIWSRNAASTAKKLILEIFAENFYQNRAPPPLKKGISQNPSIFLIIHPKASHKPKIVKFDGKMRPVVRKNEFRKFWPKIGPLPP